MRTVGPSILLVAVLLLSVATAAVLLGDLPAQAREDEQSEVFQRLVGGLGFGPAVDLSRCPFSFDPRLGKSCQHDQFPIPGGSWLCPQHASSIFFYRSLSDPTRRAVTKSEKPGAPDAEAP